MSQKLRNDFISFAENAARREPVKTVRVKTVPVKRVQVKTVLGKNGPGKKGPSDYLDSI